MTTEDPIYELLCKFVKECMEYPPKHVKADITFNLRKFTKKVQSINNKIIE